MLSGFYFPKSFNSSFPLRMDSNSSTPPLPPQSLLLEVSLISAQDLAPVSKSIRAYAVTWIHPNRKFTTRTDQHGHTNPTWNENFHFRVDDDSLLSNDASMTVEIYTMSWFRDILVGTVSVLISDVVKPLIQDTDCHFKNTRFVTLQVRRPSGNPQGILSMGVCLVDKNMRSRRFHSQVEDFHGATLKKVNSLSLIRPKNEDDQEENEPNTKVQLGRSFSMGSEVNNGSMVNGSMVNGSEICSDIGPSASIVAAELALKSQPLQQVPPSNQIIKINSNTQAEDTGSSILEDLTVEEAKAKGYRTKSRDGWRDYDTDDNSDLSEISTYNRHSRRNSDSGLFSCFGTAYGIEFTIVCGANNHAGGNKLGYSKSKRKKSSETNSKSSETTNSKSSETTNSKSSETNSS